MLTRIAAQWAESVKVVITLLGLSFSIPQLRHVIDIADALITSDGRHNTLRKINETLRAPPTDGFAVADCFRQNAWTGADIRTRVLVFLLRVTFDLVRRLKLDETIRFYFDASFCIKDTQVLEAVDWHHGHTASRKRRKVYCHGSVYVLGHVQIGWIMFMIDCRLYLWKDTVRRINQHRPRDRQVVYQSKLELFRAVPTSCRRSCLSTVNALGMRPGF